MYTMEEYDSWSKKAQRHRKMLSKVWREVESISAGRGYVNDTNVSKEKKCEYFSSH